MSKLAVLVSGGGTNLQAILDAFPNQVISVIADRDCYALERAANAGVAAYLVDRKLYRDELSLRINALIPDDCDLIVLAGFLSILDKQLIQRFPKK